MNTMQTIEGNYVLRLFPSLHLSFHCFLYSLPQVNHLLPRVEVLAALVDLADLAIELIQPQLFDLIFDPKQGLLHIMHLLLLQPDLEEFLV